MKLIVMSVSLLFRIRPYVWCFKRWGIHHREAVVQLQWVYGKPLRGCCQVLNSQGLRTRTREMLCYIFVKRFYISVQPSLRNWNRLLNRSSLSLSFTMDQTKWDFIVSVFLIHLFSAKYRSSSSSSKFRSSQDCRIIFQFCGIQTIYLVMSHHALLESVLIQLTAFLHNKEWAILEPGNSSYA